MPSQPTPTWYIGLAIIYDECGRFLLVDEKRDRGWYLPAGRIEPGEPLFAGTAREVVEETGIEPKFTGIIRFEHTPGWGGRDGRMRIILAGVPTGGQLKTEPDSESNGAGWFTLAEAKQLRLRTPHVLEHLKYVASGQELYPLSLLTPEGAPYRSVRQL